MQTNRDFDTVRSMLGCAYSKVKNSINLEVNPRFQLQDSGLIVRQQNMSLLGHTNVKKYSLTGNCDLQLLPWLFLCDVKTDMLGVNFTVQTGTIINAKCL